MTFNTLGLSDSLLHAVQKSGYTKPTLIQEKAIPVILSGKDVMAAAQTGTGKTAGFTLPLLQLLSGQRNTKDLSIRALVLTPTRELAAQVQASIDTYGSNENLRSNVVFGGVNINPQKRFLRRGLDILVATPGRLLDLYQQKSVKFDDVEILILDEADRMLDMGFIPQVRQVVARTPKKECRQTLLFSATFTPDIIELGSRWAMDPIMVDVEPEQVAAVDVNQIVYLVTTADKYNLLYNLITEPESKKVLVFSNRRDQVRRLADNLYRNGINCGALSGEIPQNKRIRTLDAFKTGKLRVLVATDVAGRGLHISDVTHVVNYTLPEEAGDYVHRIGRTGRAGAVGTSISFACEEDSFLLPAIEEKLGHKLDCIHPDEELLERAPGFVREVQSQPRPDNRGNSRPRGNRRPARKY